MTRAFGRSNPTCLRLLPLVLLLSVWARGSQPAMAQGITPSAERVVHESWSFKEGAPEAVRAFAQTSDGYLWVGAPAGLFRFDGLRFELFRSQFGDQLQSTNISGLFAPRTGGLWVGFVFGGFSFIKDGRIANFPESSGGVISFAEDRNGVVWAAAKSGMWRFDGKSWQRIGTEWNLPFKPFVQVGADRDGRLWALTDSRSSKVAKELFCLLPGEARFRTAGEKLFIGGFTWDPDHFVLTTPDKTALDHGIELDGSLPAFPIVRNRSEQVVDRANNIWFFPEEGIGAFRHRGGESLPDIVRKASAHDSEAYDLDVQRFSMRVDREGSIWVASFTGVHRFLYSPLIAPAFPKEPGPWYVLAPDEGGAVWISNGSGLGNSVLYRVVSGKPEFRKSQAGLTLFAYSAPDHTFWFAGEGGLWHMVNGTATKVELPKEMAERAPDLTTITQDASGRVWVSFAGAGLYWLKDGVWSKYVSPNAFASTGAKKGCPASGVVFAFTDILNRVWLGCTKSQLAVLAGDSQQEFGPKDGLEIGNITAIYGKGPEIWIGGEFGLQQFDRGRFHTVHAIDRDSFRGISGIVEMANGDLWLNGLGGIVHIRRSELQEALRNPSYQVSGERFDRRSGLPGLPSQLRRAPTAIAGTDGRLWFTVNNGVVWLDPERATNRTPPPAISIESVSADDKGHPLDESLKFPAHTSNVQISYAAISLLHPEGIRYRYKLLEDDRDWHDAGTSNFVSYRNLAPGAYHFQVNASDTNGMWSDKSAVVQFTVLPAFYQTNLFRAIFATFLLAVLWAAYQLRIRHLQHQFSMTLDARVSERTRIARELHDTLLQSFHYVLLSSEAAFRLLPERPAEAKDRLGNAIDAADRAVAEGRDAVQGLRQSTVEKNDLASAITTLGEELASETRPAQPPSLHVAVEGESRNLHPIIRDEIYKIAAEGLRNAFRHAEARRVIVDIRYDSEQVRLRVCDDGRGIGAEVLSGGSPAGHYGLAGMRERASVIGGRLTVSSAPNSGTELELCIPAGKAYSTGRGSWITRTVARRKNLT